jgi:hypothetical protein
VDETHVYWLEGNVRRLSRAPVDGGCVESRTQDSLAQGLVVTADGVVTSSGNQLVLIER